MFLVIPQCVNECKVFAQCVSLCIVRKQRRNCQKQCGSNRDIMSRKRGRSPRNGRWTDNIADFDYFERMPVDNWSPRIVYHLLPVGRGGRHTFAPIIRKVLLNSGCNQKRGGPRRRLFFLNQISNLLTRTRCQAITL